MSRIVNLLVDLRDEKYSSHAMQQYLREIERAGFSCAEVQRADDSTLAWIDSEFGGAWSSEVLAGKCVIARQDERLAGFACYGATGLQYAWLRAWQARADVGIFGPFGVHADFRGTPLGKNLLLYTLGALRRDGYASALLPAVGNERLIEYYMRNARAVIAEEFDLARWTGLPVRATVLASGTGTNFQAVLDACRGNALGLDVAALVSNNARAYALERAKLAEVPTRVALEWDRKIESRATYDERLLHAVEQTEPDLILLLGWMHVLSERFVSKFPDIINIHPAFLPLDQTRDSVGLPDGSSIPAFRGAHAIRDALAAGVSWVGATSHRVNADTDRGAVLVRKPLSIGTGHDAASVMRLLRPIEHRVLLAGINRWLYERPA